MLRRLLSCTLLVLICGCGSNGKVAQVSGTVTLNGKPTADIAVTFQPVATDGNNVPGPAAFGVTDADGRYTLKLFGTDTKGATVGKNQVKFTGYAPPKDMTEEGLAAAKAKVNIPLKYWNSNIEFDVPAKGTDSADFQLTSP